MKEKNKDEVILKYEQMQIDKAEDDLKRISEKNTDQSKRLSLLKEKIDQFQKKTGANSRDIRKNEPDSSDSVLENEDIISSEKNYDLLYEAAFITLRDSGMDPDDLDYHGLISDEELKEIEDELNKGLPREYKWSKGDYFTVFAAAFIGSAADIVLSDRENKYTGVTKNKKESNSKVSEWLNNIHEKTFKHKANAPIDYQGKDFGGGYHRELSKGHDLARFVEGIKMFKQGKFEAIIHDNGIARKIVSDVNQFGNPYHEMSLIQAILEYFHHMLADLCSTYSLPFPGYSFLQESDSRKLRKLAADLYQNGFNCKNIIIQSVSTIIVELTVRIYFSIMSVKQYSDNIEIEDDFSNWEATKAFFKPSNKDKLNEMLMVAHSIVTAVNVGKIVIQCLAENYTALAQINVTELMAVVRYGVSVTKAVAKRNDEYAKLIYHAGIVNNGWEKLDEKLTEDELLALKDMKPLVV